MLVSLGHLAQGLTACADAKGMEPTPSLDVLMVLPAASRLMVGESAQLGAQRVTGQTAANVTDRVQWRSDDEAVVTVSYDAEAGAVATAVGIGTAHVTAIDDGVSAEAEITVRAAISALELDTGLFELAAGTSKSWGAVLIATDGSKSQLSEGTWGSSAPDIATVSQDGTVTGVAAGEASITLTSAGLTTTQPVFVRDWTLESIETEVEGGTSLLTQSSAAIRVTGTFSEGHTQDITGLFAFDVAQPDPAQEPPVSVDGDTLSAGDKAGTAQVEGNGKSASIADGEQVSFEVNVIAPSLLQSLGLQIVDRVATQGEPVALRITGDYGDGVTLQTEPDSLSFEPNDLVYYDPSSGKLTPLAAGTLTITAKTTVPAEDETSEDKEVTATEQLEIVSEPLSALTISAAADNAEIAPLDPGESLALKADASFGAELTQDVSDAALWKSSDPSIAVVSNVRAGRVTGLKPGTVTITATYRDETASLELTVP